MKTPGLKFLAGAVTGLALGIASGIALKSKRGKQLTEDLLKEAKAQWKDFSKRSR